MISAEATTTSTGIGAPLVWGQEHHHHHGSTTTMGTVWGRYGERGVRESAGWRRGFLSFGRERGFDFAGIVRLGWRDAD